MQYRIDLSNDEVPTKWYNINADLPVELPAPKNSEGKDQISTLPQIFVNECLNQEFATDRYISIPKEVRELYQRLGNLIRPQKSIISGKIHLLQEVTS